MVTVSIETVSIPGMSLIVAAKLEQPEALKVATH